MANTIYVTGPSSLLLPKLPNGDPNPLWDLLNYADIKGIPVEDTGAQARLGPMSDYNVLTLSVMQGIVAMGGDVQGYEAWIYVPSLEAVVPAELDDRPKEDIDGNAINQDPLTWEDYCDAYHTPTVIDGKTYIPTDARGKRLRGAVLARLMTDGHVIKSLPEIQTLLAENAPTELT